MNDQIKAKAEATEKRIQTLVTGDFQKEHLVHIMERDESNQKDEEVVSVDLSLSQLSLLALVAGRSLTSQFPIEMLASKKCQDLIDAVEMISAKLKEYPNIKSENPKPDLSVH